MDNEMMAELLPYWQDVVKEADSIAGGRGIGDLMVTVAAYAGAHVRLRRREALEEAAKVCEAVGVDKDDEWGRCDECAAAIRALIEPSSPPER